MSESDITAFRQRTLEQSDASQNMWLGTLFVYPMNLKTKHLPFDPRLAEANYIAKHFKPVRREGNWVLMTPDRDSKSPRSSASNLVPEPPARNGSRLRGR